jgi:hypothetical protein
MDENVPKDPQADVASGDKLEQLGPADDPDRKSEWELNDSGSAQVKQWHHNAPTLKTNVDSELQFGPGNPQGSSSAIGQSKHVFTPFRLSSTEPLYNSVEKVASSDLRPSVEDYPGVEVFEKLDANGRVVDSVRYRDHPDYKRWDDRPSDSELFERRKLKPGDVYYWRRLSGLPSIAVRVVEVRPSPNDGPLELVVEDATGRRWSDTSVSTAYCSKRRDDQAEYFKLAMPRGRPPRQDLDHDEIVRRYRAGEGLRSIGQDLKANVGTLIRILESRGVPRRPAVNPGGPRKSCQKSFDWSEAAKRYQNGERVEDIAKSLDVHVRSVYYALDQLGVLRKRKKLAMGPEDVDNIGMSDNLVSILEDLHSGRRAAPKTIEEWVDVLKTTRSYIDGLENDDPETLEGPVEAHMWADAQVELDQLIPQLEAQLATAPDQRRYFKLADEKVAMEVYDTKSRYTPNDTPSIRVPDQVIFTTKVRANYKLKKLDRATRKWPTFEETLDWTFRLRHDPQTNKYQATAEVDRYAPEHIIYGLGDLRFQGMQPAQAITELMDRLPYYLNWHFTDPAPNTGGYRQDPSGLPVSHEVLSTSSEVATNPDAYFKLAEDMEDFKVGDRVRVHPGAGLGDDAFGVLVGQPKRGKSDYLWLVLFDKPNACCNSKGVDAFWPQLKASFPSLDDRDKPRYGMLNDEMLLPMSESSEYFKLADKS